MKYTKIIVKSNYEKRGDLVLRSYIRALKKVNANLLLNDDDAIIYGWVDDDGNFYELFTNTAINYDGYVPVQAEEDVSFCHSFTNLSENDINVLRKIIKKVLFNDDSVNLGFEVSSMEDLANDRIVEFNAYDNYLSRINPYPRLSEINGIHSYNDYNSFLRKIEELNKMKKETYVIK